MKGLGIKQLEHVGRNYSSREDSKSLAGPDPTRDGWPCPLPHPHLTVQLCWMLSGPAYHSDPRHLPFGLL